MTQKRNTYLTYILWINLALLIVGCNNIVFEPESARRDCFGVYGENWPTGTELWGECYRIEETYGLNLQNQGLTGSIPEYIGQLYNLTNLNADLKLITFYIFTDYEL